MKKIKFAGTLSYVSMSILGISVLFSSCKKDDNMSANSAASQTIGAQVASNSGFSLLKAAAVKAGLVTVLEGTGPFTVFAPTDDAFQASGITSSTINSLTADQLKAILLYHTLAVKIASSDVPAGPNAKVITAGGDSVFVTKNAKGVFVNGINVVNADLPASNGVIHTISRVLLPASGNLVQVASSDTTFSFLVAAVVRASQGSTDVASLLSNGGIFTVFAPTNNAFRAAGFADIAAINAADPDVLAGILAYHVIPGRVFSSDLVDGATPATANSGKTVTISLSGDAPTVKGQSNTSASNIIATNIMATNGVIHVIDRVLLP
jgi:uncharacterized surface protein with fasciclin (FAS1) repeats